MLTISEYQNGTRNARVYKTQKGEYGVVVFEAESDYEAFKSFPTVDTAEDFAEDWVTGHVTF